MPSIVVLGASGDLASRLLFPALYRLGRRGKLPVGRIVGYARESWGQERFVTHIREGLRKFAGPLDARGMDRFLSRLHYMPGDLSPESFSGLAPELTGPALFYLALPPAAFADAAAGLAAAGLHQEDRERWRRLLIEKPFGQDLASAEALNRALHKDWHEDQLFRIDHFLGKETTQNLVLFRFCNRFLDPVWNAQHISQVQVTVAETLGLEGRYRYYDRAGALRDMLQNHLMQLCTLIAMEPPSVWDAEVLREHKVEVLRAMRPITEREISRRSVRGQYTAGSIHGRPVPAYRDEEGIPRRSRTETFAALKLYVENWRWQGVPFYLRSGKRLKRDVSEIALQFHSPPTHVFAGTPLSELPRNWLLFHLKPQEAVDIVATAKEPGHDLTVRQVALRTQYAAENEVEFSAYEELILEALHGQRTHFLRFDEAEWAWRVVQPVLDAWQHGAPERYAAGSEGPDAQQNLLDQGHRWRSLDTA